jgi:hypothetical protein
VTVQIVVTFPDDTAHHRSLNSFTFQLPLGLSPSPECVQNITGVKASFSGPLYESIHCLTLVALLWEVAI